ncbi:hypothetical protein HHI36_010805 [Cryptolaemus montrouzieri]|uniref:Uncharacterized protein n=1 Tax=Cryptolaemus montrouzieri TaxID=559131 RepID=A0ABD2MJY9_9CUCU
MSLTSTSCSGEASSKDSLIERILEQGQRLRNAMVQSILDHDPFNTDVINTATARSLVKSRLRKRIPSQYSISNLGLSDIERDKLNAFLKGDSMNRFDEIDTLEALKSMSAEDLCKTTNQVFNSTQECCCGTCLKYNKEDLNCDLKRSKQRLADDKSRNQEDVPKVQFQVEPNKHLKYVDCMRIIVHDLVLNERGNKKVNLNLSSDKKIPVCGSQTFFIEYELPFILSVPTHAKLVKKSLSSSKNNSFVRICARRLSTEAIPFKQTSMHNIKNVDQINLEGIEMKFQISCRTMKQKNVAPLGSAIFNFSRFESSPSLTCIEELPINFNDNVPIVLGKLRVTLQMGCDRIYFGREFIASFEEKLENTTNLGNQDDQANQKLSEALQSPVLTRKSYKKNSTSDINQNSPKEEQKKIIEHQKFRKEEGNSRKYGDCGLEKQNCCIQIQKL